MILSYINTFYLIYLDFHLKKNNKISPGGSNLLHITPTTTVIQYVPCLAEVKRLPLDFLWVYMYWEKTCHFINRPVKLGWSLRESVEVVEKKK